MDPFLGSSASPDKTSATGADKGSRGSHCYHIFSNPLDCTTIWLRTCKNLYAREGVTMQAWASVKALAAAWVLD